MHKLSQFISTLKPHIFLFLLIGIFVFYYAPLLNSWWMFDDTMHVKFVLEHGLEVFYKPASETGLIPANFTPWMYFNYWFDWKVFGMNMWGYGLHQLLSLSFVIISLYFCLNQRLGKVLTLLFIAWFFITPMAHTTIYILCTRHYLEGLGFAALSVLFFTRFMGAKENTKWLLLSALFYCIACLNKEIYVPLIGIFFLLLFLDYNKTDKINFKAIITYFLVAVFYILYRGFSLGWSRLLTGYGTPKLANHSAPDTIALYLSQLIEHNHFKIVILLSLALSLGLLAYFLLKKEYKNIVIGQIITLSFIICAFAPSYPIMSTAGANHHYHFITIFTVLLGFFALVKILISTFKINNWALVFVYIPIIALIGHQYNFTKTHASLIKTNAIDESFPRFEIEGKYLLSHDSSTTVFNPVGAPWHFVGLNGIRKGHLQNGEGPSTCTKICDCGNLDTVVTYNQGKLVPVSNLNLKCEK